MRIHIKRFQNSRTGQQPTLDMTPEGEFRAPPGWEPSGAPTPWADRLLRYAVLIALIGGAVVIAGLALWFALMLIPVVLGAALIGYLAFRWRLWRAQRF